MTTVRWLDLRIFVSRYASGYASTRQIAVEMSAMITRVIGRNDASVWELLQDLLPNLIVYRGAGGVFQYASIDRSLPQSDYDWSNLVEVSETPREVEYAVDGETVSIKGIDVSTYQGDIDWEKVAASGVKFVFIRLGYRGYESGLLVKDDRFEDNIRGALQNGIAVGVYFVTQAISVEEAVEIIGKRHAFCFCLRRYGEQPLVGDQLIGQFRVADKGEEQRPEGAVKSVEPDQRLQEE